MNETLTEQEKELLKNIQLIFASMAGMLAILLLAAIAITQVQGPLMPDLNAHYTALLTGAAVISFICTLIAKRYILRAVQVAKDSPNPLSGKLVKYRSALIVYIALSELPILVCVTLSFLTGNFVFQVFAAVLLGYLLAEMPRKEKVLRQLL